MSDNNSSHRYRTHVFHHNPVFYDGREESVTDSKPPITLGELKESIDELVRYLKPYSGNLLIGKAAVDEYERILKEDNYANCKIRKLDNHL